MVIDLKSTDLSEFYSSSRAYVVRIRVDLFFNFFIEYQMYKVYRFIQLVVYGLSTSSNTSVSAFCFYKQEALHTLTRRVHLSVNAQFCINLH